ncbi:hypothetical protein CANCADRAFT_67609 [Tortispora caseinolytica NRRL Y-17796]|uniref:Zn(2)-C6 fungal-type domain-containing protein n=1 Tax=Tortispora caseinolytica NRRL Y-17796 TaxID=767744 RepID=A0A1E4TLN9_9ASCO|nr:hypothetical protein CANCADRAFT_67609 [Tortispora caseinolytica NRRL Y-17796]
MTKNVAPGSDLNGLMPVKKRQNVSRACERCRRQKLRCDDNQPCFLCVRSNMECVRSTEPIRRRRKKKSEIQITRHRNQAPLAPTAPLTHMQHTAPTYTDLPLSSAADIDGYRQHSSSILSSDSHTHSVLTDDPVNHVGDAPQTDDSSSLSILSMTRRIFQLHHVAHMLSSETVHLVDGARAPLDIGSPLDIFLGFTAPSKDVLDAITAAYFDKFHWFLLILVESTFIERFNAIWESRMVYRKDEAFILAWCAMITTGTHLCPASVKEQFPAVDFDALETAFYTRCYNGYIDVIQEARLEAVQFCALYGTYHIYYGSPNLALSLLGSGLKAAIAIRMHLEPSIYLDPTEREARRRCWWVLYIFDRNTAMAYGSPVGVKDDDITTSLPYAEEDTAVGKGLPRGSNYHVMKIRLYQISSDIMHRIYNRNRPMSELLRMRDTIFSIYQNLVDFENHVPPALKIANLTDLSPNDQHADQILKQQALTLYLARENTIMVLFRPFVAIRAARNAEEQKDAIDSSSDEVLNKCVEMCVTSAIRSSKVARFTNLIHYSRESHSGPFISLQLLTAGVVLSMSLILNPLEGQSDEIKQSLRDVLAVQRVFQDTVESAKESLTILVDLMKLALAKELAAFQGSSGLEPDLL